MIIIELPQGYYGDLTGTPKDEALAAFKAADDAFLAEHPSCAQWHRPCWREFEARDDQTGAVGSRVVCRRRGGAAEASFLSL